MLEQRLETVERAWQPAVATASRREALLEVVAILFLLPARAVLVFVVHPHLWATWISFDPQLVARRPAFLGNYHRPFAEQDATA